MNNDADFITRKLKELRAERIADEISAKREKIEIERLRTRLVLFEDELKARDISPGSELGRRLLIEWLLSYFDEETGAFDADAFFDEDEAPRVVSKPTVRRTLISD